MTRLANAWYALGGERMKKKQPQHRLQFVSKRGRMYTEELAPMYMYKIVQ